MKKAILFTGIALLVIALLIQFIPYGHDHTNPPVNAEPQWDSSLTRALAQRACFDCHSNETVWPWYSNIAPMSWLIYHDVTEGRKHINFSDWNRPNEQHVDEFEKVLGERSMPPVSYLLLHPNARLSSDDRLILFEGLMKIAESYQH